MTGFIRFTDTAFLIEQKLKFHICQVSNGLLTVCSSEALDMPSKKQYGKKKAGGSAAAAKIFGSAVVGNYEAIPEATVTAARSPLADVTLALGNIKIDPDDATTVANPVAVKRSSTQERLDNNTGNCQVASSSSSTDRIPQSSSHHKEEDLKNEPELLSSQASNQMAGSSSSSDVQEAVCYSDIQTSGKLS